MRMTHIAAALVLSAIAPTMLAAQDMPTTAASDMDERMELAREIAVLSRAEEQVDLAFERLRPGVVAKMLDDVMAVSPDRDIAAEIETSYPGGYRAFEAEFSRRYAERFRVHYPDILERIAGYWAQNMSLEELQATAEFFGTDIGSAWVRLLPGVYRNMTALGREYSLQAGIAVAGEMMNAFDSSRAAAEGDEAE